MEEKELQDELASIRSLMERSSKFISLSGLSGILAGVYALIGAGVAYMVIDNASANRYIFFNGVKTHVPLAPTDTPVFSRYIIDRSLVWELAGVALAVLLASVITAILLSSRQAKRKGQPMWGTASRSLLFHMGVPLITGGCLIAVLIFFKEGSAFHPYYGLVAPASLIFYGLALLSASNFTFTDVKYLGLFEIVVGLTAACFPGHGLLFWAFGFGVLHIIYGSMMYFKYDK